MSGAGEAPPGEGADPALTARRARPVDFSADAQRGLPAIVVICGSLGLLGWAFYGAALALEPFQDWMVFHTTARAYYEGHLASIYDGAWLTAQLNERFAAWLSWPLPLHPWLYPPHFLLLLLPFGALPFSVGMACFLLLTFLGLIAAMWCYAHDRRSRGLLVTSLLLCPATAITVMLGQNAFLTSALLIGGFGVSRTRPLTAGFLLGVASYKPQFWLMVPVALIAARQWRVLAAAAASALGLAAASAAMFGLETWRTWLDLMIVPNDLFQRWVVAGRLNGQSVYACAIWLGTSPTVADMAQISAAVLAIAAVYWSFRQRIAEDLQLAILLAATVLAAPHVIGYDAVMLAVAATFALRHALQGSFGRGETVLAAAMWLSPLINPPSLVRLGVITPLLIALFIAFIGARAGVASADNRQAAVCA
ncbi:MAG TPA: glycosyltransferase family 87 protein [Stellaceae bacterium]|nr:glycosyltransferase family 87 protein [Stellaceae bacterium]